MHYPPSCTDVIAPIEMTSAAVSAVSAQVKATDWGARLEPHSSAKALTYRAATETMAADGSGPGGQCVGGYAFKWGWKTQVTVTWVNLLNGFPPASARAGAEGLEGGETTEAVDEISRSWRVLSHELPAVLSAVSYRAQAKQEMGTSS